MGGRYYYQSGRYYIQIYWEGKARKIWHHAGEPIWHEKVAIKLLNKIRGEIDEKTFNLKSYLPESPLAVNQYAEKWVNNIGIKFSTRTQYKSVIRSHISPYWRDKDLRKIRFLDIVEFSNQLPEGMRYSTMICFKSMIRFAWRNEDIPKLPPFPKIKCPDNGPKKYLSYGQQQILLTAIPDEHRPIFEFMMEYGLRPSEARALQWDCVGDMVLIKRNFSINQLTTTKTDRCRSFKLTTTAKRILNELKVTSPTFVFVNRGKPYSITNMHKIWTRACDQTGIKIKLYNGVRHSFASQLLNQGAPMDVIQHSLGHTRITTTEQCYAQREQHQIDGWIENRDRTVVEFPEGFQKAKC